MNRWKLWLPLVLFAAFVGIAIWRLMNPGDNVIASQMVGKPLPAFDLPQAVESRPALASSNFQGGEPRLLNIFASWCVPCIAEAPHLDTLARSGVEIDGVAIRDRAEDINAFLSRNGNPYTRIGRDDVSAVQLAIGSSGVPETFVIDSTGTIIYQHVGDIRAEDVPVLLEKLEEAK